MATSELQMYFWACPLSKALEQDSPVSCCEILSPSKGLYWLLLPPALCWEWSLTLALSCPGYLAQV